MTTIVLSSEDEDDCLIIDSDGQVDVLQPLEVVYVIEDDIDTCLLKENDSEDQENQAQSPRFNHAIEEAFESLFFEQLPSSLPKVAFENERNEDLHSENTKKKEIDECFFDDDTCDINTFSSFNETNKPEAPEKHELIQNNNVAFQRLAEALTTVLSNSIKNLKVHSNEKKSNFDLMQITEFHTETSSNIKPETIDCLNAISQPSNKTRENYLKTPAEAVKNRKRKFDDIKGIETSTEQKTQENLEDLVSNSSISYTTHNSLTQSKKKRGRKPGWRKVIDQNSNKQLINPSLSLYQITGNGITQNKKKRGRKLGWRKSMKQNHCYDQISSQISSSNSNRSNILENSFTENKKNPGREPKCGEVLEQISSKNLDDSSLSLCPISVNGDTHNKKKPGRKIGWRKSTKQNPCYEQTSNQSNSSNSNVSYELENSFTQPKKGLRKVMDQNSNKQLDNSSLSLCQNSVDDNTQKKKKPGRKLGWRKSTKQNPCYEQTSNQNNSSNSNVSYELDNSFTQPMKGLRKVMDQNSKKQLNNPSLSVCQNSVDDNTKKKKKPGRKLGWRKSTKQNTCYEQISNRNSPAIKSDHIDDSHSLNNIKVSLTQRTMPNEPACGVVSKVTDSKDPNRTISNETKNQDCKSQVVNSLNILGEPNNLFNSTLHHASSVSDPSSLAQALKENIAFSSGVNDRKQDLHPRLNIQTQLRDKTDRESMIFKEYFSWYYTKIFDSNLEHLYIRLAEMLHLTMKEATNFSTCIAGTKSITCKLLQEEKIKAAEVSLKLILIQHKSSFCLVFHEIVENLLFNEEVCDRHEVLFLTLFLKIFLKATQSSPEFLESLSIAKWSLNSLLEDYLLTASSSISRILRETFWRSNTDFEKNVQTLLDLLLPDSSDKNKYLSKSADKFDETTQADSERLRTQSVPSRTFAEVSVIVKNQNYSNLLSPIESEDSTSHIEHQRADLNSYGIQPEQCSPFNFNNTIDNYNSNDLSGSSRDINCMEEREMLESKAQNVWKRSIDSDDISLGRHNKLPTQNRLQLNSQITKEKTFTKNINVKMKVLITEDRPSKVPKAKKLPPSLNVNTCSQQNIPLDNPATKPSSILMQKYPERNYHNSLGKNPSNVGALQSPPSELSGQFTPHNYVHNQASFSLPNNVQGDPPTWQITEQVIHRNNRPPPPYPVYPSSAMAPQPLDDTEVIHRNNRPPPPYPVYPSVQNQFHYGHREVNASEHCTASFNKTTERLLLPVHRNQYSEQNRNFKFHYLSKPSPDVHKTQSFSFVSPINTSHRGHNPYNNQYTESSFNQQYYNQNHVSTQKNQYPNYQSEFTNSYPSSNKSNPSYGVNHFTNVPRNSVCSTNMSPQNMSLSTPQKLQGISSNAGITVNNYNINTYVPPSMTGYFNQKSLFDSSYSTNTTSTFNASHGKRL